MSDRTDGLKAGLLFQPINQESHWGILIRSGQRETRLWHALFVCVCKNRSVQPDAIDHPVKPPLERCAGLIESELDAR